MTFAVGLFALVTQTILAVQGARVLVDANPPSLLERLIRLVGYFTMKSNVLVAVTAFTLLRTPDRDGRFWRVVRVAALVGITITGIVHWFFLRPVLDLAGWSYLCDKLLHVVIPLLAVVGWLLFGPRPRVTPGAWLLALIWPAAWLAYTLVRGAVTGFRPLSLPERADVGGRVGGRRVARGHRPVHGGVVAVVAGRPADARTIAAMTEPTDLG